jgi:hypothetical protein
LGDINYSLYFSPVKYDQVIWGVGPSINLPTASDDQLGSGKWSAGFSAAALSQPKWGTVGGLVRQLWSFAGDDDRKKVNQTLIEPFLNYNLYDGWYLTTDLVITANWEADSDNRWTVPLGGGAGRLFSRRTTNQCQIGGLLQRRAPERGAGVADFVLMPRPTWHLTSAMRIKKRPVARYLLNGASWAASCCDVAQTNVCFGEPATARFQYWSRQVR